MLFSFAVESYQKIANRWVLLFFLITALFFGATPLFADQSTQKTFVIIIPSYNNRDWYEQNLSSVLSQNYQNFRVIYVNDASTDTTGDLVEQYLRENDLDQRVTLIQNKKRIGALANIYNSVWLCDPKEIVVTVDGDDWLYHSEVLHFLNELYSNNAIWMTYGQFIEYPTKNLGGAAQIPHFVTELCGYRGYDWVSTHLRTFYAGLFQKIQLEDFLHNGEFFPVAWDLAFMFPMLEMAGYHSQFVPDILYVYNVQTPFNDRKLHLDLQRSLDEIIRQKTRYCPILSPF